MGTSINTIVMFSALKENFLSFLANFQGHHSQNFLIPERGASGPPCTHRPPLLIDSIAGCHASNIHCVCALITAHYTGLHACVVCHIELLRTVYNYKIAEQGLTEWNIEIH